MTHYYIGLMSGTSIDGVDAVVVDFAGQTPGLAAHHSEPIPVLLKKTLQHLCVPGENEIDRMGQADREVGKLFAEAVANLLSKAKLKSTDIAAIGSHGQTIRHRPNLSTPFTLQIGDPNTIAALAGITTVADFRRKDMAIGGQGAPLVPAFHTEFMRSDTVDRIVLNLGGIANITVLAKDKMIPVIGFDTGPANGLIDAWIQRQQNISHDEKGQWAASGKVDEALLKSLLSDAYFSQPPPKSTGREYFNLAWLEKFLNKKEPPAVDVQRTLIELTAQSIVQAIQDFTTIKQGEIIVCGGGVHNDFLLQRLSAVAKNFTVKSSASIGIDPDWLEAMAFAWFAKRTLEKQPSNLPSVTGAEKLVILGGIYYS